MVTDGTSEIVVFISTWLTLCGRDQSTPVLLCLLLQNDVIVFLRRGRLYRSARRSQTFLFVKNPGVLPDCFARPCFWHVRSYHAIPTPVSLGNGGRSLSSSPRAQFSEILSTTTLKLARRSTSDGSRGLAGSVAVPAGGAVAVRTTSLT